MRQGEMVRQQHFTVMIIYSELLPPYELIPFRCINCSRMLCKLKGKVLWLTNSAGIPLDRIDPGIAYVEKRCHSCKADYKLLFQ